MKIMQLHTTYREPGGEDATVFADRSLLQDAGHHVETVTVPNPSNTVAAMGALATSPWNGHAANRIRQVAQQLQPDIVHVHNTWFALSPSVLPALSALGLPVVITLHNYRLRCAAGTLFRDGHECELCLNGSALPGLRHRCYRDSVVASAFAVGTIALNWQRGTYVHAVDRFLVPGETARARFIRAGLPETRVVVRPNAVPDQGRRTTPPSVSQTIVFVGRLSDGKGLETLLDAWYAARIPKMRLAIIGDGPLRSELERRGIPGVSFLGRAPADEVATHLRNARALVFPSTAPETFGLVPIEAMAAGLPLLVADTSDVGNYPAADGGFVLPPGDVDAWTHALKAVPQMDVDKAGAANRQRYEQRFSAARSLAVLRQTYEQVIRERAGRGGAPPT